MMASILTLIIRRFLARHRCRKPLPTLINRPVNDRFTPSRGGVLYRRVIDMYIPSIMLQTESMNLDCHTHRGGHDPLAIWRKCDRVDILTMLYKCHCKQPCLRIPDLNSLVSFTLASDRYPLPIGGNGTTCAIGRECHSQGAFWVLLRRPRNKCSRLCIKHTNITIGRC